MSIHFRSLARLRLVSVTALLAALVLAASSARASGPPPGIPSGVMPWEYHKYQHGYKEPHGAVRTAQPAQVAATPRKYKVHVSHLRQYAGVPQRLLGDDPNSVLVVAHLPEDASIWFDGHATRQRGVTRQFVTPPAPPDRELTYDVRIVWYEDGQWVSQNQKVPVRAGDVTCIDIVRTDAPDETVRVREELAKLGPEDRKVAETQKFCAVQGDNLLGSMGVPVKVVVKGEAVFVCCEACRGKALAKPDETLARVQKLKAK